MSLEAERLINHVYQMDCMKVLQELPTASVDLIIADPPY